MTATIIQGNALALPIADETIDLILTSPPYFGLRSYQDDGSHYHGQIGSEPTPGEFIDALIQATCEMVRVLKPSGSIWVNLADKYAGSHPSTTLRHTAPLQGGQGRLYELAAAESATPDVGWGGVPTKSLMGLPWRYAIRCIDELGLILRAEVIWSKPNGLPESVTDRVCRSHEQWFHFTREPRYFAAVDNIREPHAEQTLRYYGPGTASRQRPANAASNKQNGTRNQLTSVGGHGKLPGSVWSVPTQPLTVPESLGVDHFAAFPMEWPRRIIRGWSPAGICAACGEGRRPVTESAGGGWHAHSNDAGAGNRQDGAARNRRYREQSVAGTAGARIVGEACACADPTAPTRPAIVLDPFGGTGTTATVAHALGRHGVSVDMSHDYCRLARWRTTDPGERARAALVEKPPVIPDDMDALFDIGGGT